MRVHQMPVLPEPPQPRPAPKNSETARLRAEFEEVAALMDERQQEKDRQPPRRGASPPRKPETGLVSLGASSEPFDDEPVAATASSGIDLLV